MGNVVVEVCLISARGLRRTSSLWKLQWFAVGWIDSEAKYCTKIDALGNSNPVWNTKFSVTVDDLGTKLDDLVLHVEVYSREPVFLRERLEGEATVPLREFIRKYVLSSDEAPQGAEELGSFQLRKRKSNKPQGFVDISIKMSKEFNAHNSYPGQGEGFQLRDPGDRVTFAGSGAPGQAHRKPPSGLQMASWSESQSRPENHIPSSITAGPSRYFHVPMPVMHPPPLHPGSKSSYVPRMGQFPHENYTNMPTSGHSNISQ